MLLLNLKHVAVRIHGVQDDRVLTGQVDVVWYLATIFNQEQCIQSA